MSLASGRHTGELMLAFKSVSISLSAQMEAVISYIRTERRWQFVTDVWEELWSKRRGGKTVNTSVTFFG